MLRPVTAGALLLGVAEGLEAQTLQNGDFTGITTQSASYNAVASIGGQIGYNVTIPGWSTVVDTGLTYTMVWADSAETSIKVSNTSSTDHLGLYQGVTVPPVTGGSTMGIVGADAGVPQYIGFIYQQVTGLTVGQKYNITFEYAGAQEQGFTGTQQEAWDVGFTTTTPTTKSPSDNSGGFTETAVLNNTSSGFTGWNNATIALTADSSSEYLEFFAAGSPTGVPPFSLLTDVGLSVAPEPSTIFGAAFLLVPVCVRLVRKYRSKAAGQV